VLQLIYLEVPIKPIGFWSAMSIISPCSSIYFLHSPKSIK